MDFKENKIKVLLRKIVPYYIRKRFYYFVGFKGLTHEKELNRLESEIKQHRPIKVLFIVANISMWRAQGLFDLLRKDSRFEPRIIISSFGYYKPERAAQVIKPIKDYFNSKRIDAPSTIDNNFNLDEWFMAFNPDILFICQPYPGIHSNVLDIEHNYNRLLAYIPYGTPTVKTPYAYDTEFHNRAWRFYLSTPLHLLTARRLMHNNAKNVRIIGEPVYERFCKSNHNPWKKIHDGKKRKRIIWAPHFSFADTGSFLHRGGFLLLHDIMPKMAIKYKDQIQIAFKPHPNLYHTLVDLENWGEERAKQYYQLWASMINSQLVDGDFIDLFKTSDAMIHDCGSFTGDYLMTKNPVLFTDSDVNALKKEADDFGRSCLDLHYFGSTSDEIEKFILDCVINGNDILKSRRTEFFKKMILSSNGKSASENIYDDLLNSLGLERN